MSVNGKIFDVVNSRSFYMSLISIFLMCLSGNGIDVSKYTPDSIYSIFTTGSGAALIGAIFTLFLELGARIYTVIAKNGISWKFLGSDNVKAAIISILSLFIGAYFNQFVASLCISLLTQILNVLFHFLQPVSPVTPLVVIAPLVDEKKSL